MQKRKLIISAALLLCAIIFTIAAFSVAEDVRKNEPTPTPTMQPTATMVPTAAPTAVATKGPATKVTVLGGGIFISAAKQRLLDVYNLQVESIPVSTFKMKEYKDLDKVDAIWPGSASAFEDFTIAQPGKILDKEVVFRTFAQVFTRRDLFLDDFLKYGVVYEKDGSYYVRYEILVSAMKKKQSFSQMLSDQAKANNVQFVEKQWMLASANCGYSDPTASSGGLQNLFLMANYMVPGREKGGAVVKHEDMESILPFLVENWKSQPLQDKQSPDFFNTYVNYSGSIILGCSSESLYLGWYNKLPENRKGVDGDLTKDGNLIVPMYPEWTVSTDHMLGALTPNGKRLVEIFRTDTVLQQTGWDLYGMRTAVGGIAAKPGKTNLKTIAQNPLSVGDPNRLVFEDVTNALNKK